MSEVGLPVDLMTLLEVQAFLYREARLLDEGLLEEWLSLFTDDGEYIMPIKAGPLQSRQ